MTIKLDKNGKILIPEKIREELILVENDHLSIRHNGYQIILEITPRKDWVKESRLAREQKIFGK